MAVPFLGIPIYAAIVQYTNVQRGTIFMWMFTIFIILIMVGIRLISGQVQVGREVYQDNPQAAQQPVAPQNLKFTHRVLQAQQTTVDDAPSVKMVKRMDRFNTLIMPIFLPFALNFVLGATYTFSLILYFIVLVLAILFNVIEIHRMVFEHKAFIAIFQNLWLIAVFFWFLNIWVTRRYQQPYYIYEA